jgi:hypothetical protein
MHRRDEKFVQQFIVKPEELLGDQGLWKQC